MRKSILALFFIFCSTWLFAEGVVVITSDNQNQSFDLNRNLFYFIDTANQYTFNEILDNNFDRKFVQSDKATFFYKKGSKNQWYKFEIVNQTDDFQQLIFSINNPLIDDAVFFSSIDSVYYHAGLMHPFDQRQIKYKNFLFEINLNPGDRGTFCLKITGQERPLSVPFSLNPAKTYRVKLRSSFFWNGMFYAVAVLLILLVIVLINTEKDHLYRYFLLLIVFVTLNRLWRDGLFFQYVWPNAPGFNSFFGRILYPLTLLSLLLFARKIHENLSYPKFLNRFFVFALCFGIIITVGQLFFNAYTVYYIGLQIFLLLIIGFSIWSLVSEKTIKKSFLIPHILALMLVEFIFFVELFFHFDIKGIGHFDEHLSVFVIITFFIAIMFILISKFNKARIEVLSLNKNLEQLVEKRTQQLNSQKEELRSQREELILQKETLQTQREELRAQKELLEVKNVELAKLSLVASKTDNLIYIFKPNGDLDWFNASFSSYLNMSHEEYMRGEPINIVDVSTNKNIKQVLQACLREKTVVSFESKKINSQNMALWFHTTLTPILDERDNVKHLIAIDTDITRLKQYEEEINQQKSDAEHQRNLAVTRKEELEARQDEIMDSIRYAKRIQTAIMPKVKQIQRDFSDSFVLFLPKDIVSGDFYWYHRIKDKHFIAAVDCTGHGVPGAFMSIIGNYLLNSIIIHNGIYDPAEILKQLNRKIKIALKADDRSQTSDGMDIALVVIDKQEKTLEFASALRPLYLFNDGQFIELKGDKIPITSNISGTSISNFSNHLYNLVDGDMFYIFSDGIIDQFGGRNGKKFLTKRFKQLLFEISPLAMREQKDIIKRAFDEWKIEAEQVDDILVMGIRYNESRDSFIQ